MRWALSSCHKSAGNKGRISRLQSLKIRLFSAALLGLFLILATVPVARGAEPLTWKQYQSPDGQFSLEYPARWLIQPLSGHGVSFVDPELPLTGFTYGHGYRLPKSMTIFEANLWWLRVRQTQFSGYGILDQRQVQEGNAYWGLDVLARFPHRGRTYTERYFIYIMRRGDLATGDFLNVYFTYQAPLPEYIRMELDIFLPMVESIRRSPAPVSPVPR